MQLKRFNSVTRAVSPQACLVEPFYLCNCLTTTCTCCHMPLLLVSLLIWLHSIHFGSFSLGLALVMSVSVSAYLTTWSEQKQFDLIIAPIKANKNPIKVKLALLSKLDLPLEFAPLWVCVVSPGISCHISKPFTGATINCSKMSVSCGCASLSRLYSFPYPCDTIACKVGEIKDGWSMWDKGQKERIWIGQIIFPKDMYSPQDHYMPAAVWWRGFDKSFGRRYICTAHACQDFICVLPLWLQHTVCMQ